VVAWFAIDRQWRGPIMMILDDYGEVWHGKMFDPDSREVVRPRLTLDQWLPGRDPFVGQYDTIGSIVWKPKSKESLCHLSAFPRLEWLSLGGHCIDVDAFAVLSQLTALQELRLWTDNLDREGIKRIGDLRNLKSLYLSDRGAAEQKYRHLVLPAGLRSIDLSEARIDDEVLRQLGAAKELRRIDLSNTGIEGYGLRYLAGLEKLESLAFVDTRVDDDDLFVLRRCRRLTHIVHGGSQTTPEGRERFRKEIESYQEEHD
jgi:hypothetical protein